MGMFGCQMQTPLNSLSICSTGSKLTSSLPWLAANCPAPTSCSLSLLQGLPEMDIFDLFDSLNTKKNLKQFRGGQAHVYTWSWTNCDLLSARPSSPLIPDGAPVAFKHMMPPGVGRNFTLVKTEEDHQRAGEHGSSGGSVHAGRQRKQRTLKGQKQGAGNACACPAVQLA